MNAASRLFIEITKKGVPTLYRLQRVESDKVIWRLVSPKGNQYEVVVESNGYVTCTCADCTFNHDKICKHTRSLKAEKLI
jgi:hypothetical protein